MSGAASVDAQYRTVKRKDRKASMLVVNDWFSKRMTGKKKKKMAAIAPSLDKHQPAQSFSYTQR
jgi:hypothetical protein